ncbi:hypothetical protein KQI89_10400 [Clostridium sp. MSJ-4]|uniref:Uncharacterized protein n=1 Tax=Clostridium simiarum TaxID=2841506 RepID=A0ABS6F0Z2_9CLOT|nr:hypothetical protein [Clostridium simiarum]MBU5592171.1 hypothetical protein [Clostridium simiarum]
MDEERIEELLYNIGKEKIEAPERLILKVKEHINYKPLIYLIPLSFLLNISLLGVLGYFILRIGDIRFTTMVVSYLWVFNNLIVLIFILVYNRIFRFKNRSESI